MVFNINIIVCFVCVALTELIDLAAACLQLTFDYDPNSSGRTQDGAGVTALFGRTVALDHRPSIRITNRFGCSVSDARM